MSREEIRKLVGGYATGTLTESERRMLFEAALEDQDLFDQLAAEQTLKETLEAPGAKQRLIAALGPGPKQRWSRTWRWATAAATLAVAALVIVVIRRPPDAERGAEVQVASAPQAVAPEPTPARAAQPQPAPALQAENAPALREKVTPAAPVIAPPAYRQAEPAPPPPAAAPAADAITEAQALKSTQTAAVKEKAETAAKAPQPAAAREPAAPQTAGQNAIGGFAAGGRGGRNAVAALASRAAPAFGFDYAVTPEGGLRVTTQSNGFLSVVLNDGTLLLANHPVRPGEETRVELPASAASAAILFTAQASTDLTMPNPSRLDAPAGSKSDPGPTPASRLVAIVPLTPRQ